MSFDEEWTTIKATDYCIKVADGTHDSPKRTDNGKPLITSKHIKGKSIDFASAYLISDDDFTKINQRSKVDKWDVLISMIGEYCGYCYVETNEKIDYAVKNVGIFKTGERTKAYWLYYYLTSPFGKEILKSLRGGTSQPYISLGALRGLNIQIPTVEKKMLKIVSILSSLDDKIELNRQTNETLEAIAQALFKEWFVDFNFPGATGKMVESELGEIPKGWRVGILGEVCLNFRKTIHPKDLKVEVPYLGLEHIQRKNLTIPDWDFSNKVDSQKFCFTNGDLLFGKLRPYFHKVGIAPIDGICSTDILVIRPLEPSNYSFVVTNFFSDSFIVYVSSIADGTRMPRVDWTSISKYKIVMPPKQLLTAFHKVVSGFYEKIAHVSLENQTLVKLRGELLPRLMKGEITLN